MATDPQFAAVPNIGGVRLGSAETDLQVPTNSSTVFTAGASGSKIEEVVFQASISSGLVATTVAGLVYLFLHNGTVFRLFDALGVTANTASTTAAPLRVNRPYSNLILPTGWTLRASQSVAANANLLEVWALGGDL